MRVAAYQSKAITDKKVWEDFVLLQAPQTFLHSWNWGETHVLFGNKIHRLGYYDGEGLVGVCLVIKEAARRGSHFIVPGGPLIDWSNTALVDAVLKDLKKLARKENVWFIRMRPELHDTEQNRTLFSSLGFLPAPMHLHAENTWVLDITPPEDEILANMRKTTRNLIRKSLKLGLTFAESHDLSDVDILTALQDATVHRHDFVGFPKRYFTSQLEAFGKDNQACLYLCCENGVPLVATLIIFYGDYAYYHISGSNLRATEIPASYFMQWNIIQEAKKRNCQYYNFWGIAPAGVENHRFAGVTLFKKGFGGEAIDWLHAQDLPTSPLYYATFIFEQVRKRMRGL
jgi:lipid II:glycine glycyltransferase (peptidoglycan interpeptide bridge formation enzyme)